MKNRRNTSYVTAEPGDPAMQREIVITRSGVPKVKLVGFVSDSMKPRRPLFGGAAGHLASMPASERGPGAEELVRADRDARGW
ncbi:MAG: hypothetical protein KF833_22650 [Verrucomicrobiae bacterium]|nr:hypothetical protein [Verrucomicrobiae bacterium]